MGLKKGICMISAMEAGGERREKLSGWITEQSSRGTKVRGVMCVVIDGKRHMKRVRDGQTRLLQLNEVSEADLNAMERRKAEPDKITADNAELISQDAKRWADEDGRPCEIVGPYVFDAAALQWAREELEAAVAEGAECLVVDEAGPLELKKGRGLEPCLSSIVLPRCTECLVVVVIRPKLRDVLSSRLPKGAAVLDFPPPEP